MSAAAMAASRTARVEAGLPFVEALARRMAATMPHSIDLGDLVQDGVIGLIDAAHRFDESRGIKFETFAERRVRGAMIDALRKDAWPRGVRRVRRELEAAREKLRATSVTSRRWPTSPPKVGSDEKRLGKTIVRINTIESTSPLSSADNRRVAAAGGDGAGRARASRRRLRAAKCATACAPRSRRCRRASAGSSPSTTTAKSTMKEIGAELGVNESRVSQLHARALRRLREALGADGRRGASDGAAPGDSRVQRTKPEMAQGRRCAQPAGAPASNTGVATRRGGVVAVRDYASASRAARSKSPSRNGLASQRQPLSSRNRSASVPATSPVTKITRRASAGVAAAMAR